MKAMIRAILIDYNRTMAEGDVLLPGVEELLGELATRYRLALFSRSRKHAAEREATIRQSSFAPLFQVIKVVDNDKKAAADQILKELGVDPHELLVVDDKVAEGPAWANQHGCVGVWCRRGKFAEAGPNEETGQPGAVIADLTDLPMVLEALGQ